MAKKRTPHTGKKDKAQQMQIWVDPELLGWLDDYCERHDRSRAWVINEILRQYKERIQKARDRRKPE